MKFNYQSEKRKFEKKWKTYEKECRNAGMSEEAIAELKAFDLQEFRKERIFCMHNKYISEMESELKYEDSYFKSTRHDWVNQIDDEEISELVHELGEERIEILTQYVFEGFTQEEIAEHFSITRSSVADRISVIKKKLKKVSK